MHDIISVASFEVAELTFSQLADIWSFIPQIDYIIELFSSRWWCSIIWLVL